MKQVYIILEYDEFGSVEMKQMAFKERAGAFNSAMTFAEFFAERHNLEVMPDKSEGIIGVWRGAELVRRFDVKAIAFFD